MSKNFRAWPATWPKKLSYPEVPVFALLEQTARRCPGRTALIFDSRPFTYAELNRLSDCFAAALTHLGVTPGERVAIHLPNCLPFVIAYFGALKAGAVFTPLSPLLREQEILRQLNDSGAKTLVTLDPLYPHAARPAAEAGIQRVIVASIGPGLEPLKATLNPPVAAGAPQALDMDQLLSQNWPAPPPVNIDPKKDLAHLAFTGGTTGVSKAVMLTHFNIVSNCMQISCWFSGTEVRSERNGVRIFRPPGADPDSEPLIGVDSETQLNINPWFHAMGIVGLVNNIFCGTTIVSLMKFDPGVYLKALETYRPTILGGAPALWARLLNAPGVESLFTSVKLANSGAGPLSLPLLNKMLDVIPGAVCESYGMSECTMFISSNLPMRGRHRQGSVGLPTFDTEIKIVDPDAGVELPFGREGEICIKGPQVMQGYWNQPEETAMVLKDGWLHSGDIGRIDEDGFLFITDRKKDMIIYNGYNVYPRELEDVIHGHPAVSLCAVLGKPDPEHGEVPVAFVQLKDDSVATQTEMLGYVNDRVAHYKKVREVRFVDDFPLGGPGKVLKRVLRDRFFAPNGWVTFKCCGMDLFQPERAGC